MQKVIKIEISIELQYDDQRYHQYIEEIKKQWNDVYHGEGLKITVDVSFRPLAPLEVASGIHSPDARLLRYAGGNLHLAGQQRGIDIFRTGVESPTTHGHEFGHLLGLTHSSDTSSIMHKNHTLTRAVQWGDVKALYELYR